MQKLANELRLQNDHKHIAMNKPKIIFIKLPLYSTSGNLHPHDVVISFRIAYAATLLKNNGYYVEVIDNQAGTFSITQLSELVIEKGGQIIFIEAITPTIESLKRLAYLIKSNSYNINLVFAMGQHPSVLPHDLLNQESFIDACVIGEPEYTVQELVDMPNGSNGNIDLASVKGVAYFDKDIKQVKINPSREYIQNLDNLPFVDYVLFNTVKYKKFSAQIASLNKIKWGFLLTSRGCPYNCCFCSSVLRTSLGSKFRAMSATRVVDEIEYLSKRFGFNTFSFEDDNFTFERQRVIDICNQLIKRKLKIRWVAQVHLKHLDKELIYRMKEANCDTLRAGVEAGSQRILDILNRNINIGEIREKVCYIKKAHIPLTLFFMINNPFETYKEMRDTLKFAKELNPVMIHVRFCTAYPDSQLYNMIDKEKDSTLSYHYDKLHYNLSNVDVDAVRKFQKTFYKRFFISGRYLINYMLSRGRYNFFRIDEWNLIFKVAKYLFIKR